MAGSDSSINLSLRLRRGSSDSRDSFYMDFDKGIDSDIDMPCHGGDRVGGGGVRRSANDTLSSCEVTDGEDDEEGDPDDDEDELGPEQKTNWVGLQPPGSPSDQQPVLAPSPISPSHMLASPEPTSIPSSHGASLAKLPNGCVDHGSPHITRHRTTNGYHRYMPTGALELTPPALDLSPPPTPTTPSQGILKMSTKDDSDDVFVRNKVNYAGPKPSYIDTLFLVLSAMYAKLLVVMGIGFPLSEVISPYVTTSFFVAFYLYLYFGSILFLIYAYTFLLRDESHIQKNRLRFFRKASEESLPGPGKSSFSSEYSFKKKRVEEAAAHCGSFYLRMGAVAFGIGSMIYSGLEFGQFFELDPNSVCYSVLAAITPCTQMAFTFIQLYFIFLNSKMCIYKYKNLARFGLMHMVATNLCVWLNVLIQESKHEILAFSDPHHKQSEFGVHYPHVHHEEMEVLPASPENDSSAEGNLMAMLAAASSHDTPHRRVVRGLRSTFVINTQCRRVNIMGQLVQDASPFLFPCTIEYSLICAAILYIMWKNIGKSQRSRHSSTSSEMSSITTRRHQYSVDCAHANKGLFTGILVLVLAIISLILFFVLINKPEYKDLAVLEAHVCELGLYSMCTIAAFVATFQVRKMRYNPHKYIELDNILLVVAQTGVYLFAIFCIIGGHFTMDSSTVLVLLTALANLVQATVQTIFILDATRRHASSSEHVRKKPGREMITFLLVCNFAMWAINSLETRRADSNPVQLHFYGFWAWTIISHVSSPLAIFFRFHSTVCLCEIWKKIYKPKAEHL